MTNKTEAETVECTEVKLKRPHTHRGVYYDMAAVKKGVTLKLRRSQVEFLRLNGVVV